MTPEVSCLSREQRLQTTGGLAIVVVRCFDPARDSFEELTLMLHRSFARLGGWRSITVPPPRQLVAPHEMSKKTLAMIDKSVANLKKGKVSKPVDLLAFKGR